MDFYRGTKLAKWDRNNPDRLLKTQSMDDLREYLQKTTPGESGSSGELSVEHPIGTGEDHEETPAQDAGSMGPMTATSPHETSTASQLQHGRPVVKL